MKARHRQYLLPRVVPFLLYQTNQLDRFPEDKFEVAETSDINRTPTLLGFCETIIIYIHKYKTRY